MEKTNTIKQIEEHQARKQAQENLSNSIARQNNTEIKKDMSKFLEGLK